MQTTKYWAPSILALAIASPTMANDLNINGFLSVGASMLDDDKVEVAGADTQGGFKQNTILGLQVRKQVNDSTSVTGQLVSRGSDDYSTEAAWAFVTYAANDNLDLRMGRLRIPAFYYSDFLEVGYTYNSIRPAEEVYRLPFSSFDGVDFTQRFSSGNIDGNVQVYYGRYVGDFKAEGDDTIYAADFRNLAGISLNTNFGNFGTRLSYNQGELNVQGDIPDDSDLARGIDLAQTISEIPSGAPVGTAINTLNPGALTPAEQILLNQYTGVGEPSASEDFNLTGQTSQFIAAALTYDDGTYNLLAEWTSFDHETSLLADDQAWMASAAMRMGEFTPHVRYSTRKEVADSGNEGRIQKQLGFEAEQSSITLGLRYDYDSSTALKFEAQHHDEKTVSGVDGESAMLYSVSVDLVF